MQNRSIVSECTAVTVFEQLCDDVQCVGNALCHVDVYSLLCSVLHFSIFSRFSAIVKQIVLVH